MGLCVCGGFRLVRDQDIDVGQDLGELIFEELSDEGSGEVEDEWLSDISSRFFPHRRMLAYLVLRCRLLCQSQDGRHADGQVVSTHIVELGVLHLFPDLRLLQMLQLVLVRGSQICTQRAIVARDDDAAATRRSFLVISVFGLDSGLLADVFEERTVFVAANAADVNGGIRRKDVLENQRVRRESRRGSEGKVPAHLSRCFVPHLQQ